MELKGAKVAITGGNRGIGWAVAEAASLRGAQIITIGRSWPDGLSERLKKAGAPSVQFLEGDLSSREGVEKVAGRLEQLEVDILFNNAGQLTGGLLEEQPLDEIYSMFQVNLNAVVHLTRAVIPGMIRRRRGKIVNNSSVSAIMHFPCASTYAASKAAIVAFTDSIESELTQTGVTTLCLITPGIKTRMFDEIESKYAKNFAVPKDSIAPADYAEQICRAIECDERYLTPKGVTGLGLFVAKNVGPIFRAAVRRQFHR